MTYHIILSLANILLIYSSFFFCRGPPIITEPKTHLTMIAHVNPGGGVDTKAGAYFANKLCAAAPPAFIRKLERAAQAAAAIHIVPPPPPQPAAIASH